MEPESLHEISSWNNFMKDYCLLLQMNTFGQKNSDFHGHGPYVEKTLDWTNFSCGQ